MLRRRLADRAPSGSCRQSGLRRPRRLATLPPHFPASARRHERPMASPLAAHCGLPPLAAAPRRAPLAALAFARRGLQPDELAGPQLRGRAALPAGQLPAGGRPVSAGDRQRSAAPARATTTSPPSLHKSGKLAGRQEDLAQAERLLQPVPGVRPQSRRVLPRPGRAARARPAGRTRRSGCSKAGPPAARNWPTRASSWRGCSKNRTTSSRRRRGWSRRWRSTRTTAGR